MKLYDTYMDAFRAATAHFQRTGEILMQEETSEGKHYLRPMNEEERRQSRESGLALLAAEAERHTPLNGGQS